MGMVIVGNQNLFPPKIHQHRPLPSPRQSFALLIYICLIGFGAKWSPSAGKFEPIVIISYMGGRKPLCCILSSASSTNVL